MGLVESESLFMVHSELCIRRAKQSLANNTLQQPHDSELIRILAHRATKILPNEKGVRYGVIAPAQLTKQKERLDIRDVPRHTQMGPFPAPAGAPGGGRYSPPVPADPALPTLWIIGDSTVRNGTLSEGPITAQWGWGAPIVAYFDLQKINVVNRAFGGTSSRTFYSGFFWKNLQPQIKRGDFVLLQFGANDNGGAQGKGALRGIGDETEDVVRNEQTETVHTFGGEQFGLPFQ
jgi:hypothetical protein